MIEIDPLTPNDNALPSSTDSVDTTQSIKFRGWLQKFSDDWNATAVTKKSRDEARDALWIIGILGVCAASVGQPLLRYADTLCVAYCGGAAGSFAFFFFAAHVTIGCARKAFFVLALVMLAVTIVLICCIVRDAGAKSIANDQRCTIIQDDMLSAAPRLWDGPRLFQALSCVPSGTKGVSFPPSSR